jgi:gluconokinase
MGVAGCGKSSLAAAIASQTGLPLIEGDEFHSAASIAKMRAGIPLTDADRAPWLDQLSAELMRHGGGGVLACSALKQTYRDRLRAAVPDLKFVFLDIDRNTALERVLARMDHHQFPASLVDSQFAALERPTGERGVLTLRATDDITVLCGEVLAWMTAPAFDHLGHR